MPRPPLPTRTPWLAFASAALSAAVRCRQNCHLQQHVSPQSQLSDVARTAICNNTSVRKVSCQMSARIAICNNTSVRKVSCQMSPELPSATTRQSAKSAVRCRQNCHLQQHVSPQSQLSDVARIAICNNTSVRKVSCHVVCGFARSDTLNILVLWCIQNVRQDGSSFTWHQPCNKRTAR